ncbi:hypothetical protein BC831DRAFT_437500 [Entophlyctis helioformis]|nr:hypothetical protein BC831DRAFT_437500 [Entophlyctis helioformis]
MAGNAGSGIAFPMPSSTAMAASMPQPATSGNAHSHSFAAAPFTGRPTASHAVADLQHVSPQTIGRSRAAQSEAYGPTSRQPLRLPHRPPTAPTPIVPGKDAFPGPQRAPAASRRSDPSKQHPSLHGQHHHALLHQSHATQKHRHQHGLAHEQSDAKPSEHPPSKPRNPNAASSGAAAAKDGTAAASVAAGQPDQMTAARTRDDASGAAQGATGSTKAAARQGAGDAHDDGDHMGIIDSSSNLSDDIVAAFGRPKVPHDFHLGRYSHAHNCSMAPAGMVLKTLAFTQRHRGTTFGVSNRIQFLRDVYTANGPTCIRKPFPAAYHGPGGEGRQFALGLSLAGSAGDDRVLDAACTYGPLKPLPNGRLRSKGAEQQGTNAAFCPLSGLNRGASEALPARRFDDPHAPRHIRDVIHINGGEWQSAASDSGTDVKRPIARLVSKTSHEPAAHATINTRYACNTEWKHKTHVTVQAPSESHFYMSEPDRFTHLPFVDDDQLLRRQNYRAKIETYVRDKNTNSIGELMRMNVTG